MRRHWEFMLIAFFIAVYIFIRSIHFVDNINFSQDQAQIGIEGMRIIKEKKLQLIGPPFSYNLKGRYIFQGPLINYLPILFFASGNFDPPTSTFLFIVFGAMMIIPFYLGAKWLINQNGAILIIIIYSLFPLFIDYSRFLWSPNFQFILNGVLIFLLGLYKKTNNKLIFFTIFLLSGLLLQLHYQYTVIIIGLFIYYFLVKREKSWKILLFLSGVSLGFFPILLFEARHNFYNLKTAILFLQHFQEVFLTKKNGAINSHYLLSSLLFLLLIITSFLKQKIKIYHLVGIFIILFSWSFIKFNHKLSDPFNVGIKWNYSNEVKTYNIVKSQNIKNFNVAHLNYDNKAVVQKFFLMRENVAANFEDYYKNKYLFAVTDDENFGKYKAYEIAAFYPRKILKKWKINKKYDLYLLERVTIRRVVLR